MSLSKEAYENAVNYFGFCPQMKKDMDECQELAWHIYEDVIKNKSKTNKIVSELKKARIVYLFASGSSYNAALYFERRLKEKYGIISIVRYGSYELKSSTIDASDYYIFISQSGNTKEIVNLARLVQSKNISSLGISNNKQGGLSRYCKHMMYLNVGYERAFVSTKTCFAECLLIYLMTEKNILSLSEDIKTLNSNIHDILNEKNEIRKIANRCIHAKNIAFISDEKRMFIAQEGALKIKELCSLFVEALISKELKHGLGGAIGSQSVIIDLDRSNKIKEKHPRGIYYKLDDFENIKADISDLLLLLKVQVLAYEMVSIETGYFEYLFENL